MSGSQRDATSDEQRCAMNTDRELYREKLKDVDDYYADSIHVTESGSIGINCGGSVYVKPLREWHRLAGGPLGIRMDRDWWRSQGIEACLDRMQIMGDQLSKPSHVATSEKPCETCHGDPAVCATVPGLRHCEAAQREGHSDLEILARTVPTDVFEWLSHMDLHLTEHDLRHAGMALRSAWPQIRHYFATLSSASATQRTGGLVAWSDALLIIQRGMDAYKERHLKWWKRMDGTPILNDLPVVIAEVVAKELHYPPSAATDGGFERKQQGDTTK